MDGGRHPDDDGRDGRDADTDDDDDDDEPPMLLSVEAAPEEDDSTATATAGPTTTPAPAPDASSGQSPSPSDTPSPSPPSAGTGTVPVTILTGFLGSGKTTLVKHILHSRQHGRRIAVIENEVAPGMPSASGDDPAPGGGGGGGDGGEVPLSVETMIARDGNTNDDLADIIELPNGCVCCTVKDTLVQTLEMLLSKRTDLDYVIIECSGMANPGPIASVFWLDGELGSRLRLDGIVCTVDARNVRMQLDETRIGGGHGDGDWDYGDGDGDGEDGENGEGGGGGEAAQQIAYADRIIVNKTDLLISGDEDGGEHGSAEGENEVRKNRHRRLDDVVDLVRSINPTAPLLRTTYSAVPDLGWILDADCFDASRARDIEEAFHTAAAAAAAAGSDSSHGGEAGIGGESCDDCGDDHANHAHGEGDCGDRSCGPCGHQHGGDQSSAPCGDADAATTAPNHHHHQQGSKGDENKLSQAGGGDPRGAPADRHHAHTHTSSIGTMALYRVGSVDLRRMHRWLADVLWPDQDVDAAVASERLLLDDPSDGRRPGPRRRGMKILRVKGILSVRHPVVDGVFPDDYDYGEHDVDDCGDENGNGGLDSSVVDPATGLDGRRYIVQAVNDLWEIDASDSLRWGVGGGGSGGSGGESSGADGGGVEEEEEVRCCKLVVIGRWLDRRALEAGFVGCLVPSPPD